MNRGCSRVAHSYHGNSFCFLFSLATKMFQFDKLSLVCPRIQQHFERLNNSEIPESLLIFHYLKHLFAYYA
ncbi:hypothetical protein RHSIM_Rhsim11G0059100 [Rhododendron simsii]|uniref:Uncharacterized protein n=1 Tax=Rhododendron simsii TaxID=118357 RepID=A0A834G754_RHOSS|nr:hypothetical protein RHSIM_Rhsim11G0059100 [Rhododendron simsii]